MRLNALASLLVVSGVAGVSGGLWMIYPPVAVVVSGACLFGLGVGVHRINQRKVK